MFTDSIIRSFIKSLDSVEFRKSLRGSHLPVTGSQYIALTLMATIIAFLSGLISVILLYILEIEFNIFPFLSQEISMAIVIIIIVCLVFSFAYYYPVLLAQGRKTRINLELPYAITYMQAMSSTMTLYGIFKSIYQNEDLYGEVSHECGMIVRDVDLFGEDLLTAMKNTQEITPSKTFGDLLNDVAMVFRTGGSLTDFFASKSSHYRQVAQQEMENTLKTIEIMAEIYVTAFVAGPIAIMIMLVAQNLSGSQSVEYLMPLMYFGLPVGAAGMVFLLYIIMPPDTLKITKKEVVGSEYDGIPCEPGDLKDIDDAFIKKVESSRQFLKMKDILKNPLRYYISDYQFGLVFGMAGLCIVSILYMNGTIAGYFPKYTFEVFISVGIIAYLIPIAFAYEARKWYLNQFEAQLPEFLREISDMKDMGMTLQSAIHIIANSKIGVLSSEIRVASEEIKMGTSVSGALSKMEERIGLVSVKRAISLIIKASEITDYIREILAIAIGDIEHYLKMKNERFGVSFIYVAIIYLSFGIFLYSAYELNISFITSFQDFDVQFDTASNIQDMFRISLILGFFSGIMAGQLSANTILAGLKHTVIFLAVSIVLFVYIL
ncbi:MAG: type II secretion system F family protein [Methanomicrobiaceae archaeon]|nr:type II secretion system F family protein [Methanomicrobiaceae archaeon]